MAGRKPLTPLKSHIGQIDELSYAAIALELRRQRVAEAGRAVVLRLVRATSMRVARIFLTRARHRRALAATLITACPSSRWPAHCCRRGL